MQTIRWYRVLSASVLAILAMPVAVRAQATPAKGPQPKFTEIATITGARVTDARKMPNGRIVIYAAGDSIFAYNRATRERALITRGFSLYLTMSPRGDRIAYLHAREVGSSAAIWSVGLDPATGAPTGPAQRVSTRGGDSPSLSPDGTLLAYFANVGAGELAQELVVLPATGGSERILARYEWSTGIKGINSPNWSADSKWIFASVTGDSATTIERVPAAGGNRERVFTHRDKGSSYGSIDGQVSLFGLVAGPGQFGRMAYVTANGARGEFATPSGTSWNRYTIGSPGALLAVHTVPAQLSVLDLNNGQVRDLQVGAGQVTKVVWSRDRKRLAFATDTSIVVVNSDGTGQRHFSADRGTTVASWAPDGNGVEYVDGTGRTLRVLNSMTGVSRTLASVPSPSMIWNGPRWQPDGKSFLLLTATSTSGNPSNSVVVEYGVDGSRRVVRDLSKEFLSASKSDSIIEVSLLSNRRALVSLKDPGAQRMVVVSLDGGAHRPLPLVPWDRASGNGAIVAQSDDWIISSVIEGRQIDGFRATSTGTDSTRVVRFPANAYAMIARPLDADHLLVIKGEPGRTDFPLYSLPFDGTAAKALGRVPGWQMGGGVSGNGVPDGKFFAFFSTGTPTSHIYDVDLSPIMQLVKKP